MARWGELQHSGRRRTKRMHHAAQMCSSVCLEREGGGSVFCEFFFEIDFCEGHAAALSWKIVLSFFFAIFLHTWRLESNTFSKNWYWHSTGAARVSECILWRLLPT